MALSFLPFILLILYSVHLSRRYSFDILSIWKGKLSTQLLDVVQNFWKNNSTLNRFKTRYDHFEF